MRHMNKKQKVLPKLKPIKGLRLKDVNDLLTDEQREQLQKDLSKMAKNRRLIRTDDLWFS
jgi:hypothetical protein